MKILGISLSHLHNEEWYELFILFIAMIARFGKERLGIKDLHDLLVPILEKTDSLLLVLRKSYYTQEIEAADKKRDDVFRGFHNVVKGLLLLPVAAKKEAAGRLNILLDGYQKAVLNDTHEAESASIGNLLQDLGGHYKDDVALLALADWTTALNQAQQEFLALNAKRTKESEDKPKLNLQLLRTEADGFYKVMTDVMYARLVADKLGGDVVVDPRDLDKEGHFENDENHDLHGNVTYNFVIAWNEVLKKYRNTLAQRAGRRSKGQKPEEEGGEEES
jgi:hypothetical protein